MSKWLYILRCPDGRTFAKIIQATLESDARIHGETLWREAGLGPLNDDPSIRVELVELANA